MASVKKRPDGSWRARYRDPSGREHARHFPRRVDAERWIDGIRGDLARGLWTDPNRGRITIADWLDQYQASAQHKRATTAARDEVVAQRHFLPALGSRPVAAITPLEVRAVVDRMAETLAPARSGRIMASYGPSSALR